MDRRSLLGLSLVVFSAACSDPHVAGDDVDGATVCPVDGGPVDGGPADRDGSSPPPLDAGRVPTDDIDWTTHRLLPNADFEDSDGSFASWTLAGSAGTAVPTSPGRSGEYALRVVDDSATASVSVLSEPITVMPGETLTVLAWAERQSGRAGTLYLEFRDADSVRIESSVVSRDLDDIEGWQPVSVSGVAPPVALTATVRIYSRQSDVGTTRWDDLSVASSVPGGYPAAIGRGVVLFVGDQRVESVRGLTRTLHAGTKITAPGLETIGEGVVMAGLSGAWNANPRVQGTVLPAPGGGYRLWYTGSAQTGYAHSADGITWDRTLEPEPVWRAGPGGVVESGDGGYFMLFTDALENPELRTRRYHAAHSPDGRAWSELATSGVPGWDVANATWDPVTGRFIATVKIWGTSAPVTLPRRVHFATSEDFVTWTAPRLALEADARDQQLAREHNPGAPSTPSADVYGMPAIRYGEQFLGLPWIFEITDEHPSDPGRDIGPVRSQLAASLDLEHWSRPNREPIVTPGPVGAWDHGQIYTGTTLIEVEDEVRLYYGAFSGPHAQGVRARLGLATWRRDRFVSWHADAPGSVITRTLAPAGDMLEVNVAPAAGALRVEVLDGAGRPVPGYTLADCDPLTDDTLGARVSWGAHTTLPDTRPLRLRFDLSAGELYSFRVR